MNARSVRDDMLASAVVLFRERGYTGVSIRDLVRHVEVPKGTFYNYFRSKAQLLSEIVSREFEILDAHSINPADDRCPMRLLATLAAEAPALPPEVKNQLAKRIPKMPR